MAWPRNKNSRSSAQPGSEAQVTVTPAPDAEPAPGSGQNAGVSGATHAVAEHSGPDAPGRRRRLPPIRYAHSGQAPDPFGAEAADGPPTQPVPAVPPAGTGAGTGAGTADSEQTAGLVYESHRPARTRQPSFTSNDDAEPAEPEDEGLAIFGGVATTEVTDTAPHAAAPYPDYEPLRPPAPAPPAAAWNTPVAPPPEPSGEAVARRPRSFGKRGGGLVGRNWRRGPAPGPGGSKATIRDLPPDVRLRFWRLRVTIMVIAGLLFGILTRSWVIGLTLAILAGIIDTVYRSRNAAIYANGAPQGGAQKRTRKQLAKLRRAGYFALDARPIPNSPEVIDHLVVGPTGVYALDSEKWNPKLPIRTWNGKKLYHGPDSQKMRLEHAVWEAQQASEVLSAALGSEIVVRPALAIYGPKIPWDIAEIRGVDVFSGPALRKYFRRRGKMRSGVPKLTREQARTIYDTASRLLPDLSASRTATPVG